MLTVRDIMTSDVLTLAPGATLREAVEALARRRISGAPVVSGGCVVGTISATDILVFEASMPGVPTERESVESLLEEPVDWDDEEVPQATYFTELWEDAGGDVSERFAVSECPEWDVLSEHTVDEVMSSQVLAVPPSVSLVLAAEALNHATMDRLLVVEDARLVGILTTMDVTRAVAEYALQLPTSE